MGYYRLFSAFSRRYNTQQMGINNVGQKCFKRLFLACTRLR
ncbi:hypothetical protein HMPREF1991_00068 [Hoylesella loescheii DSM 19665 = JCM 12249 = ATCC 15930]|uniref:Uncharacterized protein n=1 Tax=Hoylesella loescheii DSM 19665 = JCM 12249 = ATCC 15930 TaxID=1122985 RepID=A0A069QP89_HOYLO|nr:hypothetical protein HMPREF1991_00068 [Hoylesella loescheii DSM 19665 = JCM 12249 = ATCC 15930]